MIDFQFFETNKIQLPKRKKWLKNIVLSEKKVVGNITFVFCSDEYLLKKNVQFLKKNTFTDVIAFDYSDETLISGDILISNDRVIENAKNYSQTFLDELNRVMAHGLLHLLGYKDKTKKDAEEMRKKENHYLSKI